MAPAHRGRRHAGYGRTPDRAAVHVERRWRSAREPLLHDDLPGALLRDAADRVVGHRGACLDWRCALYGQDGRQSVLLGEVHVGSHPARLGAPAAGRAHDGQRSARDARSLDQGAHPIRPRPGHAAVFPRPTRVSPRTRRDVDFRQRPRRHHRPRPAAD